MKKVDLYGYTIFEDGTILKLNGEPMKFNKTIEISINGKTSSVSYARLIYYAFHQDFDFSNHSYYVKHKDNDITNNHIKNLYITKRKEYLERDNNKKAKLTSQQVEKIKKLYDIGEEDNKGNSINNPNKKYSYRKLAEMFGVSHYFIKQVIKGECRKNG